MGEEEGREEVFELELIVESEPIWDPKELIIDKVPEYVPMDDYLQKELERQEQERQEQERLSKMYSEKIL